MIQWQHDFERLDKTSIILLKQIRTIEKQRLRGSGSAYQVYGTFHQPWA